MRGTASAVCSADPPLFGCAPPADDAEGENGYVLAMSLARSLLFALVLAASAQGARAMTVPTMTDAELAARSDLVVDGRVVDARARWVGRRIVTFYVVEYVDDGKRETTVVAVLGGAVGRFAQKVPGAPVLEVDARYRLHLGRADGPRATDDGPPARGIVGFFRGVARLVDDGAGPPLLVPFDESGAQLRSAP